MKNKIYILFSLLLLVSVNVFSQSINDILKTIEGNNTEILAGKNRLESKILEYKADNLLEGPELKYGYFPDNSTVKGTKQVFEVSQSFQMPCYYRNQSGYTKLKISEEEYEQDLLRKGILFEAENLLLDYIFLSKKIAVAEKRLKFANDMYNAFVVRLEVGDVNALEVNKAKLHAMQVKKQVSDDRTSLLAVTERLKNLNGGKDLEMNIEQYPQEQLVELDSLLFDKFANDPELKLGNNRMKSSQKNLKVTKNLQLPKFSLGYGSETVADEQFRGVLVGVSIPLWSSKRAIQKAKMEIQYFDLANVSLIESKTAETKITYQQVLSLKENLESYETVLNSVNNEELLQKSLESGEISVIDFFTEMFYLYEIYDDYLHIEKEYYQSLSELYKYRL